MTKSSSASRPQFWSWPQCHTIGFGLILDLLASTLAMSLQCLFICLIIEAKQSNAISKNHNKRAIIVSAAVGFI